MDYALALEDDDLTEEICGSKLWIIIKDLLKWSAASENKPRIKNIFNAKNDKDKILTIEFRDKLNKYLREWAEKFPFDRNQRPSSFKRAMKVFEKQKNVNDSDISNPLKKQKIVFDEIGTEFPGDLPASSYFAIVLSVRKPLLFKKVIRCCETSITVSHQQRTNL